MSKGKHRRKEYEYERHGTTTLIAAIDVSNGVFINTHLKPTRNEEDFADFIKQTIAQLPEEDEIVLLADQLNTHLSETLVRFLAEENEYTQEELGLKGQSGFLKNMQTRKDFLEREQHRVRFLFTPKHCSWLNPIENSFAKVQRHVIKNGNFSSVNELIDKIKAYIVFHNLRLAKKINWTFKGFDKGKKLCNIFEN